MITIVLQAGGKSIRMGKDKALLPFLGIPLIKRLRDRFSDMGDELLVITNDFSGYQDLAVPLYKDTIPDRGALGGLYTALSISKNPLVGLIAADLPFASPALLAHLIEIILSSGAEAAIPSTERGLEPLHAVYRRDTSLPLVKEAIDQNLWRMNSWFDQAEILILTPEETRRVSSSKHTFLNLNTPEDLQKAEKLALNLDPLL
ncbi:MAG: NTP transferase domain-containing protein [Anaerolineales bacterium]|nr:NTP transferase domain-containing protein [Anaerolineales bacterium]